MATITSSYMFTTIDDYFNSTLNGTGSFNLTDSEDDYEFIMSNFQMFILFTVILGLISVFGIIMNTYVFIMFQLEKQKTANTLLLQALAMTDSFLLLTFLLYYSAYRMAVWHDPDGYYFSHVDPYIYYLVYPLLEAALMANIWVTVLLGVIRYIAVCRPLHAARLCTRGRVAKGIALICVVSILYQIPHFLSKRLIYSKDIDGNTKPGYEYTSLGESDTFNLVFYSILRPAIYAVVPLIVLIFITARLIVNLKAMVARSVSMQSHNGSINKLADAQTQKKQDSSRSITQVLVAILVVFSLCKIPYLLYEIETQAGSPQHVIDYTWVLADCLMVVNSSINFIIYILFNSTYRQFLLRPCRKCGVMRKFLKPREVTYRVTMTSRCTTSSRLGSIKSLNPDGGKT